MSGGGWVEAELENGWQNASLEGFVASDRVVQPTPEEVESDQSSRDEQKPE